MKGESLQMGEEKNGEGDQNVEGKMGKRFGETEGSRRGQRERGITLSRWKLKDELFAHSSLTVI